MIDFDDIIRMRQKELKHYLSGYELLFKAACMG